MNIWLVLADTGRPSPPGTAVHLLNAGWTSTMALPTPDGAFTLVGQAVAVFVEAPWDQLNRPHRMTLELVDDEDQAIRFADGNEVRIEQEITIPHVVGAPNGTPGLTTFLVDLPPGAFRLPVARRRLLWRVRIGDAVGEIGFWVAAPPAPPRYGAPTPTDFGPVSG